MGLSGTSQIPGKTGRAGQGQRRRLGKSGTTLVELVVTFALIGLFMTAAAAMVTSYLRIFTRIQDTSRAVTVSDTLLDKISGEITAAIVPTVQDTDGYYFWMDPGKEDGKARWIAFRNRSKSPIAIFASEAKEDGKADTGSMGAGELFIKYYAVAADAEDKTKAAEEIDWHYDRRVYMDYRIRDLWFSQEDADLPGVVRIDLVLQNRRTGFEYPSYRYARVYSYGFKKEYVCLRTDIEPDNPAFPVKAEEFRLRPGEGPDNPDEPDNPTGSGRMGGPEGKPRRDCLEW